MLVFYILLFLLIVYRISFVKTGFNEDYIDKEQCNAIKGIFILLVFIRHVWPYLSNYGYGFTALGDAVFMKIDRSMGQLLVAAFLFYSGYGVMESVKRKGRQYIDSMPRKRLLTTLVNYDIAVIVFLILDLILGIELETQKTILAFVAWSSIGNSCWYIFVILVCYLCTWLGFRFGKEWLVVILFVISYIFLLNTRHLFWYNTMLCYLAGFFYSKYKSQIELFVKQRYWIVAIVCALAFVCSHVFKPSSILFGLTDNLEAILFALVIVVVSMKVKVGNQALIWCGTKLFPIYIYQRLPMIALEKFDDGQFISQHPYLYVWICLIITLVIAFVYRSVSFERIGKE